MFTIQMRKKTNQNGIALAEIMLIISLVVILAVMSYPKLYTALTKAGRDSALVASDTLVKALSMYQLDKRGYPLSDANDAFALSDYTNVTNIQSAFSGLSILVTNLGGGACMRGIAARVEGTYYIANCVKVEGVNKGGYCCWKDVSGTCAVTGTTPYFTVANGWYECKKKV